jgi:hypothetical protein
MDLWMKSNAEKKYFEYKKGIILFYLFRLITTLAVPVVVHKIVTKVSCLESRPVLLHNKIKLNNIIRSPGCSHAIS